MTADDMDAKVAQWIETSGRALELRTARDFRQYAGADVSLSDAYADPIEGKPREADVRARLAWSAPRFGRDCEVIVTAECKGDPSKPWVAFYNDVPAVESENLESWATSFDTNIEGIFADVEDSWRAQPPFARVEIGSHIVHAALGNRDQARSNNLDAAKGGNNQANDAIRQTLASAQALRTEWLQGQGATAHPARIVLAVVVTSAPLYRAWLDEDREVTHRQAERVDVWGWVNNTRRRVYVLSEPHVRDFARDLGKRIAETRARALRAR